MTDGQIELGQNHFQTETDLSIDKIPEPTNAYRINERRFGIASFSKNKPYLITYGLASCKAFILYDRESRSGLLAHLSVVNDLDATLEELVAKFNKDLSQIDISLVQGGSQIESPKWPTLDQISQNLIAKGAKHITFDPNFSKSSQPRGVALNLGTGKVSEIDNSRSWTWSKTQDISINQEI
ncbi:hypothetical protein KW795_01825 [Candidatus Microgenomates bacterium]|nr:hypothetical protein [Candidatus Microgenomates bacterium]